jgi:DNA-binding SARP family transcriptional activator
MTRRLDIFLLGGFRAVVDGVDVPTDGWSQRRARDLVKLLALAPRRRMHREQVIDALWPELSAAAGGANLRKAVHFVRRALGWEDAVVIADGMIELAPGATITVDSETVIVEDPHLTPLWWSVHEEYDGTRLRSILRRSCAPAAIALA